MTESTGVKAESTNAIVTYDGIFKGMYDEKLQEMFQEGRRKFAGGDWPGGMKIFENMLEIASDKSKDRKTLEEIMNELKRYEACRIEPGTQPAKSIDWSAVADRPLERLHESFFGLPQGVFFLDVGRHGKPGSVRLVGKKLLSDYFLAFKIPELFCSLVKADMILGLYVDQRMSDSNVTIFYNPIEKSEKLHVMQKIMSNGGADAELIFPFPLMRSTTRCEWGSPPEGWEVDDSYDIMLGCGEERIRAYSIQFLRSVGLDKPILYDPACSTGVFLSTLQQAIPGSYTIGQDLSQQMANFAKDRVDEAHCANALDPKIKLGTADAVYIRFLNSEVIKTCEAEELLSALLPTVKKGGYIITFGHTPVLLSSSNFRQLSGFQFKQSVGVAVDKCGIFQYYVIQKS
ncbi:isonocardicin synthase-like [Ruditapes philippinarum]|uniref:isonocardicin synthase-like n=1 Tax=Ruditapes philippinarum TaxID=129788 RepID=UPI00295A598A|nr:isonocardicin synthase-like [Ruditapes philippinarum]